MPHEVDGACHSSQVVEKEFPPLHIRQKITKRQETNLVIVGGGLTSAQTANLAIRKGVSKVWLLMRGEFKGKSSPSTASSSAKSVSKTIRCGFGLDGKIPKRAEEYFLVRR